MKNVFLKIKNSNFPPKYTRYGKNADQQNSSFQRSYISCLLIKNIIKNKKNSLSKQNYVKYKKKC